MTCNSHFSTFQFMHEWVLFCDNAAHCTAAAGAAKIDRLNIGPNPLLTHLPIAQQVANFRIFQKKKKWCENSISISNPVLYEEKEIFYTYSKGPKEDL